MSSAAALSLFVFDLLLKLIVLRAQVAEFSIEAHIVRVMVLRVRPARCRRGDVLGDDVFEHPNLNRGHIGLGEVQGRPAGQSLDVLADEHPAVTAVIMLRNVALVDRVPLVEVERFPVEHLM